MPDFNQSQFGASGGFLSALYASRPAFLQQQQSLLASLGPSLRSALLAASPELSQASTFMQTQFAQPLPTDLAQNYREQLRTAQAARGFGGGGTGPTGEEARWLTMAADQRRMSLLNPLMGFGSQLLGMSGLSGPPNLDFANLSSAMLGSQRLSAETAAGKSQSQFAQQMYNDTRRGGFGGGGGGFSFESSSPGFPGSSGGGGWDANAGYNANGQFNPFGSVGTGAGQSAAAGSFGTGYHAGFAGQNVPATSFSTSMPSSAPGANWAGTGKSYRELHPSGAGFGFG